MNLYIDPSGGTNYDTVICLTQVTKSDSVSVVDSGSICGPNKSIGAVAISYGAEGYHIQDPDTGRISGTSLRVLLRQKATIGFRISPVTPEEGDEIETGTGFISSLSSTYAFDADATFTLEIQPYGTPSLTTFTPSGSRILLETGDGLLAENGNNLILE